jgi:hypothetical protein
MLKKIIKIAERLPNKVTNLKKGEIFGLGVIAGAMLTLSIAIPMGLSSDGVNTALTKAYISTVQMMVSFSIPVALLLATASLALNRTKKTT